MSLFTDKTLMITGGTGSFGNAVLNRFLQTDIGEIRIFSRDEKKQDDMRHEFQAKMPEASEKIKFYIGDVRDLQSVNNAMNGVDFIFHAAALKQVGKIKRAVFYRHFVYGDHYKRLSATFHRIEPITKREILDNIGFMRGFLQCSIKKGLLFLQSIIGHQIYLKHITLMFLKDRTCMVYEKRLNRIFKQK